MEIAMTIIGRRGVQSLKKFLKMLHAKTLHQHED